MPDGNGECGLGYMWWESEHRLSSCLLSPRLHADPAVSENKWFLWGLVASGQQHLVRLGECFPVSAGARAGGGGRARYSGRVNNQVPG